MAELRNLAVQTSSNTAIAVQTGPLRVSIRFYAAFVLCVILIFPIHESAQYLAYRLYGIRVRITLNTASPADHPKGSHWRNLRGRR